MRLVYLSPVPLDSFAQRPHHFVRWFHDRFDAPVLWVDPYPARLPRLADARRLRGGAASALGPSWQREPWIERLRLRALPFEPLAPGRALNRLLWRDAMARIDRFVDGNTWLVAGKPCELAIALAERHPDRPLVFDAMDNVPAFAQGLSRRWLARVEAELARRARWIVAASTPLREKFAAHADKVRLVRNALTPPDSPASARPSATGAGPLVFGYVGSIASWFDWNAVDAIAARHPDARVRLIGPCDRRPARLRANVELLPAIPHSRVYEALGDFSVGLIPFVSNELTEFVDPVKYYEYRAMGLPVMSTRFGEMRLRGRSDHVLFFDELSDATDLAALIREAGRAEEVEAFREANSWNRRFAQTGIFDRP